MENTNAMSLLEGEVKSAFERIKEDEIKAAYFLSLLKLEPIEDRLLDLYKAWTGDGRVRFQPMAVIKSILLKNLKGIRSYQQLINYLCSHPEESELLGFDKFLPSIQTYSLIRKERIDDGVRELMDFTVRKIRQFSKDKRKHLDIDFPDFISRRGKSRRTIQRYVSGEGGRITRYIKKVILPQLMLPSDSNHKYKNNDLINALGYMAERQLCANQGCNIMRNDERFKDKAPHGRTLLGRLAKIRAAEMYDQITNCYDAIIWVAKSRGLIPSHPVALALDFTDIPYYGRDEGSMVVEGRLERGTTHRYRYAVIKIIDKWGDFFLMGLPVGNYTDKRETIRQLITFARKHVNIKYIVVDRGFFSTKYLSLFEEMGVKYLMPGVKNERVKRLIGEGVRYAQIDMKSTIYRKYRTRIRLLFRKASDGRIVCFATNFKQQQVYGIDLFSLYSRRWNIETGFRVIKHEFMAKTTSTQYRIRMFMFMFSLLLYNIWVIVNAMLNRMLYGRQEGLRLISSKLFMIKFYQACFDYRPPPDGI